MTSVKVIKWVQHEREGMRECEERERGEWSVENVTEAKKLWRPQKHEKAKEIQTKVQQLLRSTLLQHFLCVLRPQTPTLPSPLCWPCLAASPDYPKLSLSRTSLCLSLDRHTITYAGNIRQGNKSANSCHDKKRANIQFHLELNVLYSISFGRVLIHQAINANVGNLKTFKPLFISLVANRICRKLNE